MVLFRLGGEFFLFWVLLVCLLVGWSAGMDDEDTTVFLLNTFFYRKVEFVVCYF